MIIFCQNTLFLKEFLVCNGCFGLSSKMKKGYGASFWSTFSAWFFHKNVPYLVLYQWTKFQCDTLFLFQDIKQNVLLTSYLCSWWRHKCSLSNSRRHSTNANVIANMKSKIIVSRQHFLPTWFILPLKNCKYIFKYMCFTHYLQETVNNWERAIVFIDFHCLWCFFFSRY